MAPADNGEPSGDMPSRRVTRPAIVLVIVLMLALAFTAVSVQFFLPPGPLTEATAVPSEAATSFSPPPGP